MHVADVARRREELLADLERFGDVTLGQQDRETVTADSACESCRSAAAYDLADPLDHLVSRLEAEGFVDRLEPVDIGIQQRAAALSPIEPLLRATLEYQPIDQSGK